MTHSRADEALDEHPGERHLWLLGADLVFSLPFVGVFPEGFKGPGKLFTERYKLQRVGRVAFVSEALRTRTPLVPCSIVGIEETYPMLAEHGTLARLLGLPNRPITPTSFGSGRSAPSPAVEVDHRVRRAGRDVRVPRRGSG